MTMFRQSLINAARPASRLPTQYRAAFATTSRVMGSGDTGAPPKAGGQGDAFQKRERASEDFAIRQREQEKIKELRKKLAEQHAHLKTLEESINELEKDSGGEQN